MFKFKLRNIVKIVVSGESGTVIGRAEYTTYCNTYLIRYQSNDGSATEKWWDEDALVLT